MYKGKKIKKSSKF
jgi:hypothetical protein